MMIHPDIDPTALAQLCQRRPVLWLNPGYRARDDGYACELDPSAAHARFARCAGVMAHLFPELQAASGRLASPLVDVTRLKRALCKGGGADAMAQAGLWLLKRDDALPVAGSVKARGGFHEVLSLAERIATDAGLLGPDQDRMALAQADARALFEQHTLSVGSTGNLGLSIGLIGVGLGFRCTVHMSAEAKAWKKSRLRARGINVVEHGGDYAAAVASGRDAARADARMHFVDDERSEALFLGYAAAAVELADQLRGLGRAVGAGHPLFVYLPCGVGGAPGGIAYGLKRLFGSHVHCFFAEPVASPCMLVQLAVGAGAPVSVYDVGLDNHTEADGLAVGQASPLVAPLMRRLLSGVFTVDDETLFRDVYMLLTQEDVFVEPSAAAALRGPLWLTESDAGRDYLARHGLAPHIGEATHVMWSTGGSLVPDDIRAQITARGRQSQTILPA